MQLHTTRNVTGAAYTETACTTSELLVRHLVSETRLDVRTNSVTASFEVLGVVKLRIRLSGI